MTSKNFIITSHGWSASTWLATVLNRHPDIICTHTVNDRNPEGKEVPIDELKKTSEIAALTGRQDMSLGEHFQKLYSLGEAKLYGSVNRYRLRDLPRLLKKGSGGIQFGLANLVRNPVSLLASGQSQFTRRAEYDFFIRVELMQFYMNQQNFYHDLARRYSLDYCDWSVMAFLAASQHMFILAQEQQIAPNVKNIQMEKITADQSELSGLIDDLSGGSIDLTEEYLGEVYAFGPINQHKKSKRLPPEEQFAQWFEWQQEAFIHFLKLSGIRPVYEAIGYDFSYIS